MHHVTEFLMLMHRAASLGTAKRRLPALVERMQRDQTRVVLTDRGYPVACLVPLDDAALLMELEHRIDTETGLQAIEAWEQNGKKTSPATSLLKRFRIRSGRAPAWPVAIADTADADLSAVSTDHKPLMRAIAQLGNHFAVFNARRLGAHGELRGTRIDGYRVIFLIEKERVVVLRVGAGSAHNLLP